MRLLLAPLVNLWMLVFALLGTPFRALASRKRPRWVRFRLKGDPPYRPGTKRRWGFGRKPEAGTVGSLDELRRQLAFVCRDPRARGVVFEVEELGASAAKREVIAQLFSDVRRAGKEVVVYAVTADTPTYELLAAADRIVMAPAGQLSLLGYAAEATALAAGLARVGVRAEFVRRGEHKTAPELFTHKRISDIQRQTIEGLLDEAYEALLEAMVKGRRLGREQAKALVDQGPFSARGARAQGLVDLVCSEVDLIPVLEGRPTEASDSPRKDLVGYAAYTGRTVWPPRRWRRLRRPVRLGVISARGMIVDSAGGGSPFGPRMVGARSLLKSLRSAVADKSCPALVLFIDSPGGSAVASELILEELQRVGRKKPVIAFFDRVAASGGYMLAIGGKEIWATPRAIAGSIGVFAGKFEVSGLLEQWGIHRTVLTRGQNAALLSGSRPFSESERAALERSVEDTYQAFLEHVAKARGKTVAQVHALGEGRVFSGRRAHELGLVDRVGGFEDACRRALELAGKSPEHFELKTFQDRGSRLRPAAMLRSFRQAQMYAFWPPALTWQGPWNGSGNLDLLETKLPHL